MKIKVSCDNCTGLLTIDTSNPPAACKYCGQPYWVKEAEMADYPADFIGPKRKSYKIMRNCCTSGHCMTCMHLPRGQQIRVEQTRGLNKKDAEIVAKNWGDYGATVVEVR